MSSWRSIIQKVATCARKQRDRGSLLGWTLMGCLFAVMAPAQEITISNAVISIPEGITLSTGGGILIQDRGAIAVDGNIALQGDWENNGQGIVEGSMGKVVLEGENQSIGGLSPTTFHDIEIKEKGEKTLASDIAVTGRFSLHHCILITHHHALTFLNDHPLNYLWENGGICAEAPQIPEMGTVGISCPPSHSHSETRFGAAGGSGVPSITPRSKTGKVHPRSTETMCNQHILAGKESVAQACAKQEIPRQSTVLAATQTMYFSSATHGSVSFHPTMHFPQTPSCAVRGGIHGKSVTQHHKTRKLESLSSSRVVFLHFEFPRNTSCS